MSDVDFSISVPPIPAPTLVPDEGIGRIPEASVYPYGSFGESDIGYDIEPTRPNQIGYEPEVAGHAFQLVSGGDEVYFRQGSVDSVIATLSGVQLSPDYTNNAISVSGNGTQYFWLKATLDSYGDVTDVSIETTEPSSDTSTQAKHYLGSVEVANGNITAVSSNLSGSQSLASCQANHYWGSV